MKALQVYVFVPDQDDLHKCRGFTFKLVLAPKPSRKGIHQIDRTRQR